MTRTLALDLGANYGYAYSTGEFGGGTLKGEDLSDQQIAFIEHTLPSLAKNCDEIVYEEVYVHTGLEAIQAYGGYRLAVHYVAKNLGIPVFPIPTGVWKKHSVGKGNAPKDEIRSKLRAAGIEHRRQDALDAVGILCGHLRIPLETFAELIRDSA